MESMFRYCDNLISIDLSMLGIWKVENMCYLFYGCDNLQYVNVSNLKNPSLINMDEIFAYCIN